MLESRQQNTGQLDCHSGDFSFFISNFSLSLEVNIVKMSSRVFFFPITANQSWFVCSLFLSKYIKYRNPFSGPVLLSLTL